MPKVIKVLIGAIDSMLESFMYLMRIVTGENELLQDFSAVLKGTKCQCKNLLNREGAKQHVSEVKVTIQIWDSK